MLEVEINKIRYDNVKLKSGFHYHASVNAHYRAHICYHSASISHCDRVFRMSV